MREEKRYICETCGAVYNRRNEAEECEKNHQKPVAISECSYSRDSGRYSRYPDEIMVEFKNGAEIRYIVRR